MPSSAKIAAELRKLADEIESEDLKNTQHDFHLPLAKVHQALDKLSSPFELAYDQTFVQPLRLMCIRIGIEMGLFVELQKFEKPQKVRDLAINLKADPNLLRRLMRLLSSTGDLLEVDVDTFQGTKYSNAIATMPFVSGEIVSNVDMMLRGAYALPRHLKRCGYQDITLSEQAPFLVANGGVGYFEAVAQDPVQQKAFNDFQTVQAQVGLDNFGNKYPIKERLLDGFNPLNGPLLVDVGGGLGLFLNMLARRLPKPYQLVLQDLPRTIEQAQSSKLAANITAMAHDFFKEQPIANARAYYLRHVLHDWPDAECISILKNIHHAMKPGYSRVLVEESVIQPRGTNSAIAALDMVMMCCFGARERSEQEWAELLEQAGLRLAHVWGSGEQRVIEAEMALSGRL
ncbi:uncharacterized protein PV09_06293 [Verruconis gallopava]|uniref:Uncharacterized protein n=1 Tax=Verruconis gallopava TaxID=253628 RepID=A0A0D1XJL7_9PEZI|nr:uncharacterized protein PV09_06293 [Verruconis gallopava]KIW02491.1 hypothetical protein PV09_06293 [Verruconis gallopava]